MFLFPPRYVYVPLRDSVLDSRAEWLCFLDVPVSRHASTIATRLRSVAPGLGGLGGPLFVGGICPPSHTYFAPARPNCWPVLPRFISLSVWYYLGIGIFNSESVIAPALLRAPRYKPKVPLSRNEIESALLRAPLYLSELSSLASI